MGDVPFVVREGEAVQRPRDARSRVPRCTAF